MIEAYYLKEGLIKRIRCLMAGFKRLHEKFRRKFE